MVKTGLFKAIDSLIPLDEHLATFRDLEYLKTGNKEKKYVISLTKPKAARYELEGLEEIIPKLWNSSKVQYDLNAALILNIIRLSVDKQFGYGYLKEIVNKLHHLKGDEQVDLVNALRLFIRRTIIKKRVEDMQLGVESYQTKVNITRPQITCVGLDFKEPYTIVYKPRGVVYQNKSNQKILMMADELYKFGDITLKMVCDNLDSMMHNFELGYNNQGMPNRAWSVKYHKRTTSMLKKINKTLLERWIMWSLESFVGRRRFETDY
ncbi:hypothetical protein Tco_0059238 [Tanacetum coccineum]